ncbi:unnamed protein product [Vitrella brassicaformis CCMP3155]|uniref:non-specific serine/threonine protein kinase n=1 Tax=Vitrella brassicaformis (strain CCMP3155) TaxID=1169540 RepID=A0A0G4EVP7_VITBC|nr:unnamed protein product [Vitrella brassicaformis CCMP3155]|eukprot:CEM02722.1 unnamed protein product [Vitrella brassicaformis CCMP3155]
MDEHSDNGRHASNGRISVLGEDERATTAAGGEYGCGSGGVKSPELPIPTEWGEESIQSLTPMEMAVGQDVVKDLMVASKDVAPDKERGATRPPIWRGWREAATGLFHWTTKSARRQNTDNTTPTTQSSYTKSSATTVSGHLASEASFSPAGNPLQSAAAPRPPPPSLAISVKLAAHDQTPRNTGDEAVDENAESHSRRPQDEGPFLLASNDDGGQNDNSGTLRNGDGAPAALSGSRIALARSGGTVAIFPSPQRPSAPAPAAAPEGSATRPSQQLGSSHQSLSSSQGSHNDRNGPMQLAHATSTTSGGGGGARVRTNGIAIPSHRGILNGRRGFRNRGRCLVKNRSSAPCYAPNPQVQSAVRKLLEMRDEELDAIADEHFTLHDLDQSSSLSLEETYAFLNELSRGWDIPPPDDHTTQLLYSKFADPGSLEMHRSDFVEFYRHLLCYIRDQHCPVRMRYRRSFFIDKGRGDVWKVYRREERMGQGQFGVVYKVVERVSGAVRCCKIVRKQRSISTPEHFRQEVDSLLALNHPSVVRLLECFEDYQNLYMVFEMLEGSHLLDILLRTFKEQQVVPEPRAARLMMSIMRAVAHCHARRIMHKDIKPENIMVTDESFDEAHTHLIDFGLSEMFAPGSDVWSSSSGGTPYYMAPEVFEKRFNYKCDIWSCGILLYLMLTGYLPFSAADRSEYRRVVRETNLEFPPELFDGISEDAICLIRWMLAKSPDNRPSACEVLKHRWFRVMCSDSGNSWIDRHWGRAATMMRHTTSRHQGDGLTALMDYAKKSCLSRIILNLVALHIPFRAIRMAPKIFAELDTDNDGTLSEEELRRGLERIGVPPSEIPSLIDALDTDADHGVSYLELVAPLLESGTEEFQQTVWNAFRQFDLNNDGIVTRDELRQMLEGGGLSATRFGLPLTEHDTVESILNELDTNKDGSIQFDEFLQYLTDREGLLFPS